MRVLTDQKIFDKAFEEIIQVNGLDIPTTVESKVVPAAQPRRWSLSTVVLIVMAFVAAGIAGVICARTVGLTPGSAPQTTYTVTTSVVPAPPAIVPAKPTAPIVRSATAPKATVKQATQVGTEATPQLGTLPKTGVASKTGTSTVTRPATGTQNQVQPDPATKPQPKPATGNGSGTGTDTAVGTTPPPPAIVPPTTTSSGNTASSGSTTTTTTTVVNSSPDGAGTTGNAVSDQGTGDQSLGSQMPMGTGPGAYNSGDPAHTGASF